jgi:hypothetical protein
MVNQSKNQVGMSNHFTSQRRYPVDLERQKS